MYVFFPRSHSLSLTAPCILESEAYNLVHICFKT
ncbi:hypothetical protein SLEP1_g2508 [Rubroshorea leprosula]|uniref:Uncharacterized protein n=1 Tax=Rubroshorea leprosula TaxID=152421 RepID=A0AAV5HHV5_9ROSI|nr:hypothetical protein SLEP1_g2508 [Rubroshorea leprosula]